MTTEEDLRNDPEIRRIFLAEARKRLDDMAAILERGEVPPPDTEAFRTLRRHAHTLKGLGSTLGYLDIAVRSEGILNRLPERGTPAAVSTEDAEGILEDFHHLASDLNEIFRAPSPPAGRAAEGADAPGQPTGT